MKSVMFPRKTKGKKKSFSCRLPIALGDTFQLVLLLDGVGVGAALGGVDEFFSETLGNGLDVSERGLTGTDGDQGNGLVDTSERGDIDGLATDGTGGTNSGAVFTGTAVGNGVDGNLERVLVGHDVNLKKKGTIVSISNSTHTHKAGYHPQFVPGDI